jgi:superfamily II RNA helicase
MPVLKEIVEILFGKGLVKLLYATETFAVGINMPTKTVVFTGYRKYDDATGGMRMLNTDEYIQMAGRAGRRGKDDKGLVLYLPDRAAEEMEDVRRMMTGAKSTFQSRMTFHYDFLLKTLQSGNLDWLKLMRQSYWYRRHELQMNVVKAELEEVERDMVALNITEREAAAMEERDALSARLKESVNAARRAAQQAWSAWENTHIGPRWGTLQSIWPVLLATRRRVAELKKELAVEPTEDVWPSLEALAEMGLLEKPVTALKLTALGTMATEVNEGHPILMPQAYQKGFMRDLTAEEILTVLAAFIQEGGEMPAVNGLRIPEHVKNILWKIHDLAEDNQHVETKRGPDTFWELNTTWVEGLWRWLQGATAQELCADYGCYEGNLMRMLMKMVNILDEWRSLATLSSDTDMLEKMRGLELKLMSGIAVCDSLYLRL